MLVSCIPNSHCSCVSLLSPSRLTGDRWVTNRWSELRLMRLSSQLAEMLCCSLATLKLLAEGGSKIRVEPLSTFAPDWTGVSFTSPAGSSASPWIRPVS
jgi:hypothetical protein